MSFSSSLLPIKSLAFELGFDHVSLTRSEISLQDQNAYQFWWKTGGAADMDYMKRDPRKRLDMKEAFPDTKSVLSLGVSYYQGPLPPKPGPGYGRVARYAWGLDYHEIISDRLQIFLKKLREILGTDVHPVGAVDTKPILERALAAQGGLGFIGKNTVLIIPRSQDGMRTGFHVGSFVFLAEILLDIELQMQTDERPAKKGCGNCTRCLSACPTDAFEGPYRLRSDRCIAYLTIENKGWISREMRPKIGDWIFGCDICQDVCPFNARAYETRWPEFQAERGSGAWISLQEVLSIPDQASFKSKWGHTPLARAKRRGMVRNGCVVAGNSKDDSLSPLLHALLVDDEPLLRGHALWALEQLLPSREAKILAEKQMKIDPDSLVQHECIQILEGTTIEA